jgi:cell division protein ZapE
MTQHTFSPPSHGNLSPQAWYQAMQNNPDFVYDASQAAAIADLDQLWHELVTFKAKRNQFLGRSFFSPAVPQGIYFWGGVGRGKSFLMDVFFDCVPYVRKRRIHFHKFMSEIHTQMKALSSAKDPLMAVADDIAASTRLLCFDELHVSDIADAMILARLLEALFKRGVVMMITSNFDPDALYPNGLQRQKFLPAIKLIKHYLKIVNIDNGNDYRLREMSNSPLWMLTTDSHTKQRMESIYQRLQHAQTKNSQQLEVQGRTLQVKKHTENIVWFDFDVICGGPRSQSDYLEIASRFSTIFISDIPLLDKSLAAQTQRLVWLIDILYDNRSKLVASAAAMPQDICTNDDKAAEFSRTSSRLIEMQSQHYLELMHQSELSASHQHRI